VADFYFALTTLLNAGMENFADLEYGVPPKMQVIFQGV
jgi:hypothetical protein